ncbi:hypothetical protein HYQ46_007275 [Verticillium longisporum]|nr:hypothetical protein HYQ46_007275 [Verticillium longisporum]
MRSCTLDGTLAALGPVVRKNGILGASLDGLFPDDGNLSIRISGEFVDGHNNGNAVCSSVLDVLGEVHTASAQNIHVLLLVHSVQWRPWRKRGAATVHLESTNCGHDDDDIGHQSGGAALDVEEALTAHGEIETCLGNNEAGLFGGVLVCFCAHKLQRHLVSEHRAVTDADVREGPGVNKDWGAFQGLHQVGLDSVPHESRQCATSTNVVASHRVTAPGAGDDHAAKPFPKITQARAEGKDGHALTGDRNIEAGLTCLTLLRRGCANSDSTQVAIIHIQNTAPSDSLRVDIQTREATDFFVCKIIRVGLVNAKLLQATEHDRRKGTLAILCGDKAAVQRSILLRVFMEDTSLDRSGEKVVRCCNGMDITCQVQVEFIHRNDLAIASASSTALDSERWALAGLTDVSESDTAKVRAQSLGETHCGGRFALAKRGWGDTSHNDILAVATVLQSLEQIKVHLGLVGTVRLQLVRGNADFLCEADGAAEVQSFAASVSRGIVRPSPRRFSKAWQRSWARHHLAQE